MPESQAYMDLLTFERKLDSTIMRKRLDIQEALKRPVKVLYSKNMMCLVTWFSRITSNILLDILLHSNILLHFSVHAILTGFLKCLNN